MLSRVVWCEALCEEEDTSGCLHACPCALCALITRLERRFAPNRLEPTFAPNRFKAMVGDLGGLDGFTSSMNQLGVSIAMMIFVIAVLPLQKGWRPAPV